MTLDIFPRYWQIQMHEFCNEMMNFTRKHGAFQLEVVPFGLKNLSGTFRRMMDNFVANGSNVKCYVNDVIIHSETVEERIKHMKKVMSLLR